MSTLDWVLLDRPAALALVFALRYLRFGSVKDGLLVFSGILSSMALTLLILPAPYTWACRGSRDLQPR